MIAARTLPKVEIEFLRPLLAGIAPDEAKPPVVSNPDNGWIGLREILETELRARGAVLMQQVRTVLLGLRQLAVLTPHAYRRAGGMSGVETLVIARALRSAGDVLGGEAGVWTARAILNALVLPAGADQPPKARRQPLSALARIAGDAERVQRALRLLQADEIVRTAGGDAYESAWQLDHDYLARSVIGEMRQADHWGTALRDGFSRFRAASGSLSRSWAALLPISVQARLLWEKVRGRLRYGETAGYAWLSGAKPGVLLAVCGGVAWGALVLYENNVVQAQAQVLVNRFGAGDSAAVLDAWKAPEPVRARLFRLAAVDSNLLYSASKVGWPAAYAGVEPTRVLEAASLMSTGLEHAQGDADRLAVFARAYAAVAQKLQDQNAIKTAAEALRGQLEHAQKNPSLAEAYAAVAQKLQDQNAIKSEAEALRGQLENAHDPDDPDVFARAYAAVAQKLQDQNTIKSEAEALRGQLRWENAQDPDDADSGRADGFARAYAAVAQKLQDQNTIKSEAEALRGQLENAQTLFLFALAKAYAAVAQNLQDQNTIKSEAEALRGLLENAQGSHGAIAFAEAYVTVAQNLQDQNAIKSDAEALRGLLENAQRPSLAWAYAVVAQNLRDQNAIKSEVKALRGLLENAPGSSQGSSSASIFVSAYAAFAQKLQDQNVIKSEAETLRGQLERAQDF